MSVRELTTPLNRVMSSDRLGVVPNTAFWMACCSRLLSPSNPVVANTVLVPPVVVRTTPGKVAPPWMLMRVVAGCVTPEKVR